MRRIRGATFALLLAPLWVSCAPDEGVGGAETGGADAEAVAPATTVVEIVARGLRFEAPDSIPSGWTTFRFRNESGMTHFALFDLMPAGHGVEAHQKLIAPVFQKGMDLLNAGKPDEAMAAFGELPEWFGEVRFLGGPGLLGPGETGETTLYVEPGTYVIECYVKTNGIFHSYSPDPSKGYAMVHELTVTSDASGAEPPEADIRITVSSERGIEVEGDPTPGRHVVAVKFEDQIVHESFVGHDLHLARIAPDTDLATLATWMNSMAPTGLETPAPVVFLGGTNEMPAGSIAYLTVTLDPGRYAWVAEVPRPDEKGMLKVFEVAAAGT
jgi:hypothetical protein